MIRALAVSLMAMLLTACVTAQGGARSAGARMIAEAGAGSVMVNRSRGQSAIAYHPASRTYCWSLLNPISARIVIPPGATAPPEAVGCERQRAFATEQWWARRASPGDSAAAAVAARVTAEISVRPDLRAMPRPGNPGSERLPSADDPHKPWLYGAAPRDPEAWLVSPDGRTLIRVAARLSGGWLYEVRSEMTLGAYREWGGGNLLHIDDLFFPPDLEFTRRTPIMPPE